MYAICLCSRLQIGSTTNGESKAVPVQAWTIQWWIQRTTITGSNWIKVNYIWVLCLHLSFIYCSIFPPSPGPFKDIYITCVPVLTKTIAAQDRKKLWRNRSDIERCWTRVVQTKAHFFRLLDVNIRLRIEQDKICFFQVLMQLYSALLPLSAPYNFLRSRCLYKVSPFPWHVDVDRNR